jgi:excisionase family DNA binding protein
MLTKQEAADRLGVSIRAVENFSTKGKLTPQYATGKRGKVALFNESEVDRLKDERGEIVYSPKPDTALATIPLNREKFVALLENLAAPRDNAPSITDLSNKFLLTIAEAQKLTSLSRKVLLDAYHTGKLKLIVIGRGYKIKTADLQKFIDKL